MNRKHDYSQLDAAILAALRVRVMDFPALLGIKDIRQAATHIEAIHNGDLPPTHWKYTPYWRFIDNRLLAMSKKGLIYHAIKYGWAIADKQP